MNAIEELIAREEQAAENAQTRMDQQSRGQKDPLDIAARDVALGKVSVLRELADLWNCTDPIDRCTPETDHGDGCGVQ